MITTMKIFEHFYEPQYSSANMNIDDFDKIVSQDDTIKKRIRFFDYSDSNTWFDKKPRFTVMFADDLIIGICKIDSYDNSEADYSISYFSIDKDFRNRKITRLMINTLFDYILDGDYTLDSSSCTHPGMTKLKPLIDKIAEERGVKWTSNDRRHDTETSYDDDFLHYQEMNDDEYKKHTGHKRKKFDFGL